MQKEFHHIDENEIIVVINAIVSLTPFPRIILLKGDLGAGKTTLVKKLVVALGSLDKTSSPTFGLINEYTFPKGKIVHTDWYRIKNLNELLDAGMEEYIDEANLMIIEWPEIGMDLLKNENYLMVEISHEITGRNYKLSVN